jgi:hypothetical protein
MVAIPKTVSNLNTQSLQGRCFKGERPAPVLSGAGPWVSSIARADQK